MAGAEIVFQKLSKSYNGVSALRDYDLEVKQGEFMTLLGPSGSGKTTALNALAGFISPDSGDIRIAGKSILSLPPERRQLGMVFQGYTLFPHMNVRDNIAFPLRLRKVDKKEVARKVGAALEMVQLIELAERMPKELSGGQQQRVAFARAVVFEPPVLLMDEPLGALDLKLRQSMQLEIKRYHAKLGCTIIFVTHDQEEALVLSDRVAVMGDGHIRQVDTPMNIYDAPNSRYVAEFIGKTNIFSLEPAPDGGAFIAGTGMHIPRDRFDGRPNAVISVRPEKIHQVEPGSMDGIQFPGVVEEVVFLGNTIQYGVKLVNGSLIMIQEHRDTQSKPLIPKDQIKLRFRLEDSLLIEG